MKVTYKAASQTNSVLAKIEKAAEAFHSMPELFLPDFWEHVHSLAMNPNTAQAVLDELDAEAAKGITVSKFVAFNLVQAMSIARSTLRNAEIQKHI